MRRLTGISNVPGSTRARRTALCRCGLIALGLAAVLGAGVIAGCGVSDAGQERVSGSLVSMVAAGPWSGAGASAPVEPILSAAEYGAIAAANRTTAARDRACSSVPIKTVPVTSTGSPDHALTSILGVLRHAATPADRFSVKAPVLPGEGPGGPIGSRPPTGEAVYMNASRRARRVLGVTFYILPAGRETGLRTTPARCDAEQAAALERALKQDPKTLRDRIGELQQQYLTWQRYEALNPEGILLVTVNAKAVGNDGGASTAQIEQHGLLDGNAGYPVRGLISGVVPDGVASVTIRYGRGSLTARVANNVFVALPGRGGHAPLTAIVWRSTTGAIIKVVPFSTF